MKYIAVLALIVVVTLAYAVSRQTGPAVIVADRDGSGNLRVIRELEVRVSDMRAIARLLTQADASPAFAAFAFYPPTAVGGEDAINIQLSEEGGSLGVDWILLGSLNERDKQRFEEFAIERGFEPKAKSLNGVSYVRVDDPNAVMLAESVVTEMYGLPDDEPLGLYHEGFEWPAD